MTLPTHCTHFDEYYQSLTVVCHCCAREHYVHMSNDQVHRFQEGEAVQDVFPNLSTDQQEFLESGICDSCWYSLFPLTPAS